MKKVLFVIHALGGGGAEKVLINLVKTLDSKKYDITLLSVIDSGIYRSQIPESVQYKAIFKLPFGKRSVRVTKPRKKRSRSGSLLAGAGFFKQLLARAYTFLWRMVPPRAIYRRFIREQYDIEVAFLEGPCTKLVASSPNPDSKKIAWVHVDFNNEPKSHSFYRSYRDEENAYAVFNRIVSVSHGVQSAFLKMFPSYTDKAIVLHNPIDATDVCMLSQASCDEIDSATFTRPVFLSVGRLCAQKAFARIIETAAFLKKKNLEATFIVLGEGPDRKKLESLSEQNDVSDMVHFVGYKENPYPYFVFADAFLCTSIAEGFSTTASEAAILGLPILTTDCAGMSELGEIYDGVHVCPNSTDEIVRLVYTSMQDSGFLQHGRMHDTGYFSLDRSTRKIELLFDEVEHE